MLLDLRGYGLARSLAEAIETTRIPRLAALTGDRTALVTTRPFRDPRHLKLWVCASTY
jgi:hypothetical protein